jgi:hypothetical protein
MNRLLTLVVGLSMLAVGCGSSSSPSAPSQGTRTTTTFTVPLSSANETPPITNADAGANGSVVIELTVTRDGNNTITSASADFEIAVAGFPAGTSVTDAHIHNGGAGTNAGIYVNTTLTPGDIPLTNGSGSATKTGINVPADRAAAILSNPAGHYFNVHTALNPAGAIRGQLAGGAATVEPGAPVPY